MVGNIECDLTYYCIKLSFFPYFLVWNDGDPSWICVPGHSGQLLLDDPTVGDVLRRQAAVQVRTDDPRVGDSCHWVSNHWTSSLSPIRHASVSILIFYLAAVSFITMTAVLVSSMKTHTWNDYMLGKSRWEWQIPVSVMSLSRGRKKLQQEVDSLYQRFKKKKEREVRKGSDEEGLDYL